MTLFLDCQFCFIGLYILMAVQHCFFFITSFVVSFDVGGNVTPVTYSPFSVLFWIFGALYSSRWIWDWLSSFCKKACWNFNGIMLNLYITLGSNAVLIVLFPSPWRWDVFIFIWSFKISALFYSFYFVNKIGIFF